MNSEISQPELQLTSQPESKLTFVVQLSADLSKLAHFFFGNKQSNPWFLVSTTWSDYTEEIRLHYDDWLEERTVTVEPPKNAGLLLFALFVTIRNSKGIKTTLHAATVAFDIADFSNGAVMMDPIKNYRADATISPVGMTAKLKTWPDEFKFPVSYSHNNMQALGCDVAADLGVTAGTTPADPFLKQCHVPVYRVADRILPGAAFFSTHRTVVAQQAWFARMCDLVAARHDTTSAAWASDMQTQFNNNTTPPPDSFHRAVAMALEIATSAVHNYEYVVDFFITTGDQKKMFESFDNFFRRRCGDCEDSAVAIKEILYQMEEVGRHSEHDSMMYALSQVAQLYVPCAVLGMVGNVSFETGQKTLHKQAHMYTKWIPRAEFESKVIGMEFATGPTKHSWEDHLMTWVGEGTSTVEPFPSIDWIKNHVPSKDKQAYECALIKEQCLPLGNMSRIYRQQWAGQPNTFYNIDIHAYTHRYSDRRGHGRAEPVVFSFVDAGNKNKWGVNFEEQLRGNYSLLPHTKYDKATLDDFDVRARVAPPPVQLVPTRAPRAGTTTRPYTGMGYMGATTERVRTGKQTSTRPCTDYVVRGVKRMTDSDVNLLYGWLHSNFTEFTKFVEGWDDFSESWRFRCFKPNKEQGL